MRLYIHRHTVEWIDGGRVAVNPADPRYPKGIDLDVSKGQSAHCTVPLPYPAARCGQYLIRCNICHTTVMCTTAGRADDPRSIKIACKGH